MSSYRAPEHDDRPLPRLVFLHQYGWEVIQSGPTRFRLICNIRGCIGAFKTLNAAIDYMNIEFL